MIKYKTQLIISVLLMLTCSNLSAQQLKEDVIYLDNGSIIRGKILKHRKDSIKIETNCHNILAFGTANIIKTASENVKVKEPLISNAFAPQNNKGFYSYNTFGLLSGNSEIIQDFKFSFQSIFGYEFNYYLGVGIGVGIENLQTDLFPVYASIKSNLLNRENSPTIVFNLGYSFPISETKKNDNVEYSYEGGFKLGFDVGICSYKTNRKAFIITAGYYFQIVTETSTSNNYWNSNIKETNTYEFNKIAIRIGFLFK